MINGVHVLVYSADAAADRAFLRDVLGWASVEEEDDPGWLVFKLPPAELGVHPVRPGDERHELYLMCDDVYATVTELEAKGVEIVSMPQPRDFGVVAQIRLPGGGTVGVYQPSHRTATDL